MIEPRIRIESDGTFTRLWLDGEEVGNMTSLDFSSQPFMMHLEFEKPDIDESDKYQHIVTERHVIDI